MQTVLAQAQERKPRSVKILLDMDVAATLGSERAALIVHRIAYLQGLRGGVRVDGHKWIWRTITDWLRDFPHLSESTMWRAIAEVKSLGVLVVRRCKHYHLVRVDGALMARMMEARGLEPSPWLDRAEPEDRVQLNAFIEADIRDAAARDHVGDDPLSRSDSQVSLLTLEDESRLSELTLVNCEIDTCHPYTEEDTEGDKGNSITASGAGETTGSAAKSSGWSKVLTILQQQVSRPSFATFLQDVAGAEVSPGRWVLVFPTTYAARYVEDRMIGIVRRCIEEGVGRQVENIAFRAVEIETAQA